MAKLSFVIPCYNSSKTIGKVIEDIIETVNLKKEYDYEIICINDSSKDNTYEVLKDIAKNNKKIKLIEFSKNFGQHSAIMAGFNIVTGDIVICLDDDGQTPPSEMFKLIEALDGETDVVMAKYIHKKHNEFRNLGSKINNIMGNVLLKKPKGLSMMSYFALRRYVVDEIIKYRNPYPYIHGLLLRTTKKIKNVEIKHFSREDGKSGYTFKKLMSLWLNGFTAFSVLPLRIATVLGGGVAILGFMYGMYIILKKILNSTEVLLGYSSIMAAILFVGGMIMVMLGLIGEYIGRIYISINKSPQYVIRERKNIDEEI